MSVWTTGTSGLETVLATLGTSVHSKGSHTTNLVSTQPASNLLSSSTHLHHAYINPTAPQFVYKPSYQGGAGHQQKVISKWFRNCVHGIFSVKNDINAENLYNTYGIVTLKTYGHSQVSFSVFPRELK